MRTDAYRGGELMPVVPYGYRTENGRAVVDEEKALQIRTVFESYISGMSLVAAAETAGFHMNHPSVKRIICNRRYMGDRFYPQIIDPVIFDKANREMKKRAKELGRTCRKPKYAPPNVYKDFVIEAIEQSENDPVRQAEYIYSRIRTKGERNAGE